MVTFILDITVDSFRMLSLLTRNCIPSIDLRGPIPV